jgi:hypothetical protein
LAANREVEKGWMSETHVVQLVEKSGALARVTLFIVHPDERTICIEKNCALQLLWDAARADLVSPCPLNKAMSVENRLDASWLLDNQDRFIASVKMVGSKNYPVPADLDIAETREDRANLPQATLDIVVTDAKWIVQLRTGMTWDTALFDANGYV